MRDSKIVLINKGINLSSHKAIRNIQKEYNFKKIGHAGTLDPRATGLLIGMTNNATKLSDLFMKKDKKYKVEMTLGFETDTLDLDGEIIEKKDYRPISLIEFKEVLNLNFLGTIDQIPPKYSAIKINGKKLYDLARKNIEVQIPKRKVEIYSYDNIEIEGNKINFIVEVSSGTYIRSLVRDIAYKLDTVATMTYLDRLSIGKFKKPNSIQFIEVYDALDYEKIYLSFEKCQKLKNGVIIDLKINEIELNSKVHIFCKNEYFGIADVIFKNRGIIKLKRSSFFY